MVTNGQWEDAHVRTKSEAPGFTIDDEHFFEYLVEENMYIVMHHTITVIDDTQALTYRYSANPQITLNLTYPLEDLEHFTAKVYRRWDGEMN